MHFPEESSKYNGSYKIVPNHCYETSHLAGSCHMTRITLKGTASMFQDIGRTDPAAWFAGHQALLGTAQFQLLGIGFLFECVESVVMPSAKGPAPLPGSRGKRLGDE
jgi:hypothetical protein